MAIVAPVLLLFVGAAVLIGAYMSIRRQEDEMVRRVGLVVPVGAPVNTRAWLAAQTKKFDATLRAIFAAGALRTWGMRAGAPKLLIAAAGAAFVTWLIVHVAFGWPAWLVMSLTIAAGYSLPRSLLMREQRREENAFLEFFPDAVDTATRMLRAGIPMSAAVRAIGGEAPAPVNAVFSDVADQVEIGARIDDALDHVSGRIGLADFRFFAVAVILQHATGGNLVATLEILSSIIRRRRAVRLKARAATAEIRISAYVLGSLPLLIVGGLLLVQPGYLAPLFSDPRGHIILAFAGGGMVLAGISIRQLMRGVTVNV
jgi:tight adherence protein B